MLSRGLGAFARSSVSSVARSSRRHISAPVASMPAANRMHRFGWGVLAFVAGSAAVFYVAHNQKVAQADGKKVAIDPKEFTEFTLIDKKQVSPNSAIYRFGLQSPEHELALPVASYILAKADLGEEKPTVRPYTPITYDQKGYFELMIKTYPDGKMSSHIGKLKVGDKLAVKGPNGKLPYTPNMKKEIGMIAGGSGITPMLQVAHEVLKNPEDKTKISLIFANVTADDILLKQRIDEWAAKNPGRFTVYYTLDKPPANWKGGVGFVNEKMVTAQLPKPSDDVLILVCGPPPMVKSVAGAKTPDFKQGALEGVLKNLGYNESNVFKF